ncbi:MAG: TetR/AcrR family transcriptional regulator [Muribaculaceae bacterium]|nr:TetR/AcrR family transcriptional regulator [Muribaculaceae bacterium]
MNVSPQNIEQTTEQKIIEAAQAEFMTKGYDGARTTVIAAKAGVTHAMFHYYFRTKEKIFEKIISQKMELLTSLIKESIASTNLPLEEKLRHIIDRHIDFIADNPELPGFLMREVFGNSERLNLVRSKIENVAPLLIANLQSELDNGYQEGRYRKIDARMLLIDIISLNVFAFMAAPLVNVVLSGFMDDKKTFSEHRKNENFDTIIRKIKA